jgi:Glucose-6-phosphate isomerase
MDEHFRTAPLEQNLPVLMGLLAVWYRDFFGLQSYGVMPYEQYLKRFPAYLQQLTMESNGKHVTLTGEHVWLRHRRGLLGRAGHQRPAQLLPAHPPGHHDHPGRPDRLRQDAEPDPRPPRHPVLQRVRPGAGLAFGKTEEEVRAEGTPENVVPHRVMEGNRPSNVLLAEILTPRDPRRAGRPVRAQRVRRGRSGTSTRSTSGEWSSGRSSRSRSFPS